MKRLLSLIVCFSMALLAQSHSVTLTWADSNPSGTSWSVYRATGVCGGGC
jgi:hypothetical protein